MNNSGPSMIASNATAVAPTSTTPNIVPPPGYRVVLDWATANVTNAGADSESICIEFVLNAVNYRICQRAISTQTVTVHADFPGGLPLGTGTQTVSAKSYTTTATSAANPSNTTINVGYHFEV